MAGKDQVYAASSRQNWKGHCRMFIPGNVKGAMHEKMAKPSPKLQPNGKAGATAANAERLTTRWRSGADSV